ncbi:MAG TPA: T9SS type A sorting domain-containing protein, partial [Flavilitoribacter sp.]|nr:T9SS type A sorting domain-containing protein [Flavilitoribacter sp.]
TWSTGSEVNNAGFELLRRSAAEKEFQRIAWINSRGDSHAETHYYFDDKDVRPGVRYYYQLNQVDFDGKSSLSDVVSAEIKGRGQWQVSPNPVSGGLLRLKYEGTDREGRAGILRVFNAQGMLVREMRISGSVIELETDDLPAGVYLLTVDDQNGRQTETIIRS